MLYVRPFMNVKICTSSVFEHHLNKKDSEFADSTAGPTKKSGILVVYFFDLHVFNSAHLEISDM